MFDNKTKTLRWVLIFNCISLICCRVYFFGSDTAVRFNQFFFNFQSSVILYYENFQEYREALRECKEELGVSEEKVKEMVEADDPKDEYSCFFGCIPFKTKNVS